MPNNCTHVSLDCPVITEVYGYAPSLAANLCFAVFFALAATFHLVVGTMFRTWFFMCALSLGCLSESVGYVGRVIMHYNVWNNLGFQTQISCLISSPSYIAAGIYVALKHIVLSIDTRFSRVKATWYTWIFIFGDAVSLCLQAAGGGLAAAGNDKNSLLQTGTNIMIGGIVFQVVVLVCFGFLLGEYFVQVWRHRTELAPNALAVLNSRSFRTYVLGIVIAFLGIFARCVYRIPELAGGWGGPIMREEMPFIILDGLMVCISVLALSICHPGRCLPRMSHKDGRKKSRDTKPPLGDCRGEVYMMSVQT